MDANSPSAALDHGMVTAVTPEGFRRRGDGRGPRLVVECSPPWRDRHLRFHEYDRVAATATIEDLLAEVERDPTAIFWG